MGAIMRQVTLLFALLLGLAGYAIECQAQSLRRAERALRSGELTEALSEANAVLADDSANYRVYDVLARIHQAMAVGTGPQEYVAHIREMKSAYDQVIALRPREEQKINVQMINLWVTEFNTGIGAFNSARASTEDDSTYWYYNMSAAHFQASSIAQPDSADSYVNWAYALLGGGEDVAAIEPLEKALEYGGPDVDTYSILARIFLTNERAADAVPLLERALFEDKITDTGLQDLLLNGYAQTGDTERALGTYEQAVVQDPDNKIYRYNYGSLLLQAEMYDAAIDQLEAAVDIDAGYVDALYNLGAAYINKANDVQKVINEKDDALRASRDTLDVDVVAEREAELEALIDQRVALYGESIGPLEQARAAAAEGDETETLQPICFALYQAYAQLNEMDKVEAVQACAGI